MKNLGLTILALSTLTFILTACGKGDNGTMAYSLTASPTPTVNTTPIKLSFFLTNDIHGHLENMSIIGGLVQQLRERQEYSSNSAGLFVLDSGDQFQGTLPSNYDEGDTVFKALNTIGYDAVIPGNHDYDFGPKGWEYDRVTPGFTSTDPREVIEDLAGEANFPMLSANTFNKNSLFPVTPAGGTQSTTPVAVDDSCNPTNQSTSIDFSIATRPAFLKPYQIITKAGVRVALIGIDFKDTTSVTTSVNVSDLCFRDEVQGYLDVRRALDGQADVFVMLMHNGNVLSSQTFTASDIVTKINAAFPGGVDLVAAGHTHVIHNNLVGDVHVIQDGCNAAAFGRVDLYVDPTTKKVIPSQTNSIAGLPISSTTCSIQGSNAALTAQLNAQAQFACSQITYPITTLAAVDALVTMENANVGTKGLKQVAVAPARLDIARIGESALGDVMTDGLRLAGGTQLAFMNAGGLRTSILKGNLLYQDLFQVTPFGNLAVVMNAMPWSNLKAILNHAIQTSGSYGTLEESGLKITYSATNPNNTTQLYTNSQLLHVELLDGTVLYDQASGVEVPATNTYSVTTLDYLEDGGDGFTAFEGVPVTATLKIARDVIADAWTANNTVVTLGTGIDHRYVNVAAVSTATPTPTPVAVASPSPTPAPSATPAQSVCVNRTVLGVAITTCPAQ